MSILLADAAKGIVTAAPATQATEAIGFTVFVFGWALVSLFFAGLLGVFRLRSIVGPSRMERDESAWSLVFILLTGTFVSAIFTNGLGRFMPGETELKVLLQSGILEGLGFCFIVVLAGFYRQGGPRLLGLDPARIPRGMLLGVIALFVLFPLVLLVGQFTELALRWFGLPAPQPHEVLQALRAHHERRFVATAILLVVFVAPMFEELAFRGCIQTVIVRLFDWFEFRDQPGNVSLSPSARSRWAGIAITAGFFAAVHHEIAFFPPLFVLAVGMGYLYERTGNLWATIFTHAFFNGVQLLLFLGMS